MGLLALGVCAALAYFTFRAAREIIERDALRTVDAVAESQRTLLVQFLTAQSESLDVLLDTLPSCSTEACIRAEVQALLSREQAEAAVVMRNGSPWVEMGARELLARMPPPTPNAMAQPFRDGAGSPFYVMSRAKPDGTGVRFVWKATRLDSVFARIPALGASGETFLSDSNGYFMTTPRYESASGRVQPIDVHPMYQCLSGEDGAALDLDYRSVRIIHGFRHVDEIGGGCIMAHIDVHEAFAPVRRLARETSLIAIASASVALALAAYLANRLTRVISALAQYAKAIRAGDFAAPVPPIKGTKEQEAFAATLASMGKALHESEQVRERFIAILAHDLQGPLAAIALSADLLTKREATADSARAAATIASNARRMSRMISDLLDFARSRRPEGLPIHPREVDLAELAATAVENARITHPNRTLELRSEGNLTVPCDPDRVLQAVGNLIDNGLRYGSPERPVAVFLRGREDAVELRVQNWGPPIPTDDMTTLFDPFRRGREAGQRSPRGLGLGLYIVDQILRAHGGHVNVTASEAEGTAFIMYWPRRPPRVFAEREHRGGGRSRLLRDPPVAEPHQ